MTDAQIVAFIVAETERERKMFADSVERDGRGRKFDITVGGGQSLVGRSSTPITREALVARIESVLTERAKARLTS